MKKWVITAKRADFNEIAGRFGISPMLARIIRNRDIVGDDAINMYLNGSVKDMHDPYLLKGMDTAVMILMDTISDNGRIFIIGDYDIDGICSSFILKKGLESIGAKTEVRLPDRVKDGYGMNMDMVDEALSCNASLILTCDNGISAHEEIKYAKEKGLKVIITDHHEVPYEENNGMKEYRLPPADAIVDPKQEDCDYPFSGICGAMVAYKLMQCMFEAMGKGKELSDDLLMFAGFATVGDIMDLTDENRIAVSFALDRMKTTPNKGMECLIDVTGVDRNRMSPYTIGFILGPCINATGRLDSANRALDMFLTDSHEEALKIALELKSLNDTRKDMTEEFKKKAFETVENSEEYSDDRVLVIYMPQCHESLAGIIAGKLKEKYYKPAFVLTGAKDGVKGSGRSIDTYDMYGELTKCSAILDKFGGHTMAAGLSLKEENIDALRKALNDNCSLTEEEMQEKLSADMQLPLKYATLRLAEELDRLKPYGKGNTTPLFAEKNLTVSDLRVFGKNRNVVKLRLAPVGKNMPLLDAIMFGDGDEIEKEIKIGDKLAVMYELDINEYNGTRSLQLRIRDYKKDL